jgi:hypothetical protein
VADAWARTRARERIEAIGKASLDSTDPRRHALDVLREVVDFGAYVWLLTDPATAVGAAPFADIPCLPELPALIKAKYATPVNRWTDLQQRTSPTALLDEVVDGDLARSRVWGEVMSRYGVRDVASTVFADRFGCWGFLDLWRDQTSEPFTSADSAFIDSVATSLTTALRECHARTFVEAAAPHRRGLGPSDHQPDSSVAELAGCTPATRARRPRHPRERLQRRRPALGRRGRGPRPSGVHASASGRRFLAHPARSQARIRSVRVGLAHAWDRRDRRHD